MATPIQLGSVQRLLKANHAVDFLFFHDLSDLHLPLCMFFPGLPIAPAILLVVALAFAFPGFQQVSVATIKRIYTLEMFIINVQAIADIAKRFGVILPFIRFAFRQICGVVSLRR